MFKTCKKSRGELYASPCPLCVDTGLASLVW